MYLDSCFCRRHEALGRHQSIDTGSETLDRRTGDVDISDQLLAAAPQELQL